MQGLFAKPLPKHRLLRHSGGTRCWFYYEPDSERLGLVLLVGHSAGPVISAHTDGFKGAQTQASLPIATALTLGLD